MTKLILISISLILIFFINSVDAKSSAYVKTDSTIGATLESKNFKENIYFTGQPTPADFTALKKQGFAHIINLRGAGEHDLAQDKKTTENLKMSYTHIPFTKDTKYDDKFISQVTNAVKTHRAKGKTLIHCGSGQRVALWIGGHFHKDHNYSKEKAIGMAKKMGLTNTSLTQKLMTYLGSK